MSVVSTGQSSWPGPVTAVAASLPDQLCAFSLNELKLVCVALQPRTLACTISDSNRLQGRCEELPWALRLAAGTS